MKIKVLVSVPAFITEVEVDEVDGEKIPGLDTDEKKQAYARNVALERTADKLRDREPWFDWREMVAHLLPGD